MNSFLHFLSDMHSSSDRVRSKSVYASIILLLVIVMCIGDQYFKSAVDKYLFTSMLTTFLGLCGMNLTAQITAMNVKKDVASDISASGDNSTAKEVLQSEKPA